MEYVRVVDVVDASIGAVWGVIAGFGALRLWMPAAESCTLEGFGVGAVRTVRALGGVTREKLTFCDPGTYRLAYALQDPTILPATGVVGEMSLRALSENKTELTWVSKAEQLSIPEKDLAAIIEPFYRDSIAGLKRALQRT
ncbi:MAG: SRPBCC family protein [Steroidobacteraceae bacterium]